MARKHYTQMNPGELTDVNLFIRNMDVRSTCDHAAERMEKKNISSRDLELVLKHGTVIEMHNDAGTARVVIRLTYGRPKVHVCAVIDLEASTLVTVWKNNGADNHATLDWSLYNWKIDTRTVIGRLAKAA